MDGEELNGWEDSWKNTAPKEDLNDDTASDDSNAGDADTGSTGNSDTAPADGTGNVPPVKDSNPSDELPEDKPAGTDGATGGQSADDAPAVDDKKTQLDRHAINDRNAKRRIRQKQQRTKDQLEERYAQKKQVMQDPNASDFEKAMAQHDAEEIERQYRDIVDDEVSDSREEFVNRFVDAYGDRAGEMLQHVGRYRKIINECEPELKRILQRPVVGPIVATEWCLRMDNPKAKQAWMQSTNYQRSMALTQLVAAVENAIRPKQQTSVNGATATPAVPPSNPTKQDIPVAASGRSTATADNDVSDTRDDFESAWKQEAARLKKSKLKGWY